MNRNHQRPRAGQPPADARQVAQRGSAETSVIGLEDFEFATLEWVDWFNHRRLFEAHGQIPPAEYEEIHHRQQERSGQQAETQTKQPA